MAAGDKSVPNTVSRRRYERQCKARQEAERLLEVKSRELFDANRVLKEQAASLAQTARQLERAKSEAEAASAAKSAFLALVSHEIRTPMNGVLGMATALSDTALTPDQADMVDAIKSSGKSLTRIINDVLDLTKIEMQKLIIEEVDFDLGELLDDITYVHALQARQKGLAFMADLADCRNCLVRGDPTRLRQVIGNLLSNAVKFTEQGDVAIEARKHDGELQIRVTDSGIGVAPDLADALFTPFQQADPSIARRFGGTGLGLAIARQICRLMAGDLVYRPSPVSGSEFVATIALKPPQAPETSSAGQVLVDPAGFFAARSTRVLVAEDNKTNQKVLTLLLKRYPLEIAIAENGADAVEMFFTRPFDIVLMDVNMPVMDGLQAADLIRQGLRNHGRPQVPIIALTANVMVHQVRKYLNAGVDAHVPKPIKRDRLVSVMVRLLSDYALCAPSASDATKASTSAGVLPSAS